MSTNICILCNEPIEDNESFESTTDGDTAHTECLRIALEWHDTLNDGEFFDEDE